jgi:2-polyprenyl-3-methyl-5-hydroxy-6-metoxy-1,4-benzoquinol methylase
MARDGRRRQADMRAGHWNHNTHYHRRILDAIPVRSQRGLDVGCGEGLLASELRRVVRHVTALDADAPVLERARTGGSGSGIAYVLGDFLTHDFGGQTFDVIASVAALHHMDEARALRRMRDLLRPGGTLAVVGLARSRYPRDLPADAVAAAVNLVLRLLKGYRPVAAPIVWPPPRTYAEIRRLAADMLPGVRFQRHLLWRYSLVWTKPTSCPERFEHQTL